jgi:hypothetical protein
MYLRDASLAAEYRSIVRIKGVGFYVDSVTILCVCVCVCVCVCAYIYIYTHTHIINTYIYTHVPRLSCNNFSAECECSESNSRLQEQQTYVMTRAVRSLADSTMEGFPISLCMPHSYRTIDTAPVHSPRLISQWWRC